MPWSKSNSRREVYSNTSLHHETGKISRKQPNNTSEELEKERIKSKVGGKKYKGQRRKKIETKKQF